MGDAASRRVAASGFVHVLAGDVFGDEGSGGVWPLFCIHSPPADRPGDRSGCLAFLHGGALGRPPFLLTQANRLPPRCNRRPEGRLDHCHGLDLMPLWGAREAS